MKIGIVLSKPPEYSETFFISKIKGLQKNGFEVVLFVQHKKEFSLCKTICAPKIVKNPILQFIALLYEFLILIPYWKSVRRYIILERTQHTSLVNCIKKVYVNSHLLKQKLDWLHFGFATMALGKENIAKAMGAKLAISIRGFDIAVYPIKNVGCYCLLWQRIDKLHTISNDLLKLAYDFGLKKNTLVQKITPAIDTAFFSKNHLLKKNENDRLSILTVARLHWIKGLDYTLSALALLKQQGIDFQYTIIGDGAQYEYLKYLAYQLGIANEVVFKGKLDAMEVKSEMMNSTIYLQYSVQEGFCNAVLEAQALGLLCIVSDAGGLSENVLDKETGWVVPKRKPELLTQKIVEVLQISESAKKEVILRAIKRIAEEFNIEKQQHEFVRFYRNI